MVHLKFAPSNRWGYFPAAALGWRMSEEAFLNDVDWLDNLKLRVSYGEVGNDGINSSLWSQNWEATSDKRYQGAVNGAFLPSYSHWCRYGEQGPEVGNYDYP